MSIAMFLELLLIVSVLTGLVVQAIKKILDEYGRKYHANTLAGIVAVLLSIGIGFGYEILIGGSITDKLAVYLIALIFLSWLCSMVGYDKVIQAISQFKTTSTESEDK